MGGEHEVVHLDGRYVSSEEARVSPDDRGFSFGDGVYEVVPFYGGRPLAMDAHVARMARGLEALDIGWDATGLPRIAGKLVERNGLSSAPMSIVYLQVTRGVAPRAHAFPNPKAPPTVYATARTYARPTDKAWQRGAAAITVVDSRWGRVDVKTLQLLPNVLAQEAAGRAGVDEAVFVRDGIALEGAKNNLFAVVDGVLRTHPASNQILRGITRDLVIEMARELGHPVEEIPTPLGLLGRATEAFLTGSTSEVRPIVRIDGQDVGDGRVGPVAKELRAALHELSSGAGAEAVA